MSESSGPEWAYTPAEREDARRLLGELVALAPTNLEDPVRERFEKPNYVRTAEHLARTARGWGLEARVFDPVRDGGSPDAFRGIPRPNVIVDLAPDGTRGSNRLLVLAHYDVVPVPSDQLPRWESPPHRLTERADGRWYGRGSNDDLGSGVVAPLLALRRLRGDRLDRPVRLLVCCDEETGGSGGIEALKAHDARLDGSDPDRFLAGEVCLIPDGAPYVAAGSSGVLMLDGTFEAPATLAETLAFGEILLGLDALARAWKSRYPSPDWPDRAAPEPVLTGRASVTRFDFEALGARPGPSAFLRAAHAETDATNLIPRAVTLVFESPGDATTRGRLERSLSNGLAASVRIEPAGPSALEIPASAFALAIVGESHHAGYPHRALNPVPSALAGLARAVGDGALDGAGRGSASFGVDLRLVPEMTLAEGREAAFAFVRERTARAVPAARLAAPEERQRGGYALDPAHPTVARLASLLARHGGSGSVYGEYGGTDASSLAGIRTPTGAPLPALVFGSMDPPSRIHEAEESVDPRLLATVTAAIAAFAREG